ncbi:MAG TPA: putative Ig domain-containing protein, partial [Longimicrobiales bacterium]|nr:putative Ig domain-containing protein [Longimicrobiales bacterium]
SVASGGQTATRAFTIAVTWPPVAISTSSLPTGSLGAPYAAQLAALGGDGSYAWSVSAGELPAGVTLATDGSITGTPTAIATSNFTVAAVSVGDTSTRALSIEIGAPQVTIQTTSLANGAVGQAYTALLVATGGDGMYEWSLASGGLPDGLALATDGTIGGTPTTVGTADFEVRANSAGLTATQALTIGIAATSDATPPTVSGVTPSVLIEGQTAVVEGSGFDLDPAQNGVTLGGVPATVTAATETSLTVTVPNFECLPPRGEPLRVIVGGLSAQNDVRVSPYAHGGAGLDAGLYTYTFAGEGCIQLPEDAAGGEFLIGVTSVSETPSSVTPFRLRATSGDAGVFATVPGAMSPGMGAGGFPAGGTSGDRNVGRLLDMAPTSPGLALRSAEITGSRTPVEASDYAPLRTGAAAEAHLDVTEQNWRLIEALGRPDHPARASAVGGPQAVVPPVGDSIPIFADPDGVSCSQRDTVQARVRYVGANAVWLEDPASPVGTFTEEEFAQLDAFYTDNVQGVHDDYFGTTSDVDGNERFLVFMSPVVNARSVLGYFWSGDLFPRSQCATSNAGEIFYGIVPDPEGTFGPEWSKQFVLDLYPELVTHEITHLIQRGQQIFGTSGPKTTWEIEGGATFAEQIVALPLFGHAQGQELGYDEWNEGRQWYNEWTNGLVFFFGYQGNDSPQISRAPEECSWLGRESQGNTGPCLAKSRAPYDVPSFFFRAILDRFGPTYPGGEAALMKRLTQSPFGGFDAIGDVTGRPIEEDLAEFYMTLWGDGLIGDLPMMTTWNIFDVFSRFVGQARLQPNLSSATDVDRVGSVRAGSNYYLYWTPDGGLAPTSIHLTSRVDASTPGTLSVWVLRVQ